MEHDQHTRMLSVMDQVHTIISGTDDIDEMLAALLGELLSIFPCDRAWLLYPCDPEAEEWWVPMEQTRPEWLGAFAQDLKIPMEEDVRYVFEAALSSPGPVTFDGASPLQVPPQITDQFCVQAQMILAIRPKTDRAWMLGIHHCREAHVYTDEERKLFANIGHRLGDSLSVLIALRELRASEANLERTVRERTEALERSNRELEQYAYVASHDLQEPLRMIASYTELLARRYQGELDDKADMMIGYIVDGAKRMQELINDLLALSRVDSRGKAPEPVACNKIVAQVLRHIEGSVQDSGAEIIAHDLPVVMADPTQLRQVFQNLLVNAIKFRGEDPPRVELTARRQGEQWELSVADNGIGIEAAFHDRIFTIFQRLHCKGEYEGSGIGLSLVKKIVERHHGRVSLESVPGQGSTFLFTMPTVAPEAAPGEDTAGPDPHH